MVKKADLGQELLLSDNVTHTLEVEYNNDMEQIFIQLRNKANGECTVLNADSIFEQAYDTITKKNNSTQARYVIHMADGNEFTGTPEDIARWYCKHRHMKLYIEPNMDGNENSFVLLAAFPYSYTLTHIAYFENGLDDNDIEGGYRLFFTEFLRGGDSPDYELTEIS